MELRHLIYFRAVAQHEHVSQAARELNVSQPAITKQLKDLERDLGGTPLFERSGRRIKLTPAGHELHRRAQAILREVEQLRRDLTDFSDRVGGRVRIGAPPTVGERLLPGVLHDFHVAYPAVELRVHEGSTSVLMQLLSAGELDMAVVTVPTKQLGMRVSELFTEELVVVVAREHRLAGRGAVTIGELRDEPFLLYSPGGYVRDATLAACRSAGFSPQVALDSGSMELLLRLAEAGLGVAIVPPLALDGKERLVPLKLIEPVLRRTMALAVADERSLTKGAARLREHLEVRLRRQQKRSPRGDREKGG